MNHNRGTNRQSGIRVRLTSDEEEEYELFGYRSEFISTASIKFMSK